MKQGNLTVAEYEKEFSLLSKYAQELVLTETFRCRQFEDWLKGVHKEVSHSCDIVASGKFLSASASGYEN